MAGGAIQTRRRHYLSRVFPQLCKHLHNSATDAGKEDRSQLKAENAHDLKHLPSISH
jgi:hypothetical protein